MSTNSDFDRLAEAWLADGPTELSDRVLHATLREVNETHQRRLIAPWRTPLMSMLSTPAGRAAAALVAVVVVAVGAIYVSANRAGVGGPQDPLGSVGITPVATLAASPTPPSTPAPTGTPQPTTIATDSFPVPFAVPFTMTWPGPIQPPMVTTDAVEIHATNGTGFNLFLISRVGKDPCTTNDLESATLKTPQQFMDWLASITHATALPVDPVMIGGHPALERELDVGDLTGCMDTSSLHSGIRSQLDTVPGGFLMSAKEHERWVAFTVGGKLVAFTIWPLTSQHYVDEANQAITSIQLTP